MASQTYEIQMERDLTARMRDGVILRADVFRPKAEGRFPVLLQRTPYNKANYNANGAPFAIRAATSGYIVILQDVRGRFASDGDWYPFRHELEDGYDTVEWAAALPYSNGKVGMFGWSYLGVTQLFAAIAATAASGLPVPRGHGVRLPCRMDISRRRLSAVLQ